MELNLSRNSKFFCLAIILTMVFSIFVGTGTTVYASNSLDSGDTEKEIEKMTQELEKELKFLFEEAVINENGQIEVNKQLLIDKYGTDTAPYIAEGIKKIYTSDNLTSEINSNYLEDTTNIIQARGGWLDCMKGEIVGLIPGMDLIMLFSDGNLAGYIEGKAWGQAAAYIAKKAVKFGIKTNVAGIAASLAVSSGTCLLPWH